ncbi:MAG: DUF4388 domain-containing protein [Acidobacteria bacterium]|jgi:hypothetical protein|nr:DUF4388 domain-containing protein [Acidobacteriota bacterium]
MSFAGRLETLELSALLQTLGASRPSGRLTLTSLDQTAVIVFRDGLVVYAASSASPETLAARLLRQGLVSEADLTAALERQHDGTRFHPLGEALAERGVLAPGTLGAVVRQRLQEVVSELLGWDTGYFHFVPSPEGARGDVEVDLSDFVVPEGMAPMELLMHAMTLLEGRRQDAAEGSEPTAGDSARAGPEETAPAMGRASFSAAAALLRPDRAPTLSESGSYTADFSGEVVLLLLRFASQILSRAVVFAVEGDQVHGVGEFGLETPGRAPAEVVGETVLSLRQPSFLKVAVEEGRPHVGPLEPTYVNLKLVKRFGGILPREAVAVPLVVRGAVRLVLYGDNGAEGSPIGPLDVLEGAATRASRILERTIASRERKQSGSRA